VGVGEVGKKAAHKAAELIQAKLVLGDMGIFASAVKPAETPRPATTFTDVAAEWERVNAPNWKKGTADTYGNIISKHLIPAFGARPIEQVGPKDLESWWTVVRTVGYSNTRLTSMRSILNGIFELALDDDLVKKNPVGRINGRLGKQDAEIAQCTYLTEENLNKVLGSPKGYAPAIILSTSSWRRLESAWVRRWGCRWATSTRLLSKSTSAGPTAGGTSARRRMARGAWWTSQRP